jgi:UDP-N-acetylmuramoyl-L-alanyl-D-glutamate--2,6-diaminopimelate ligase
VANADDPAWRRLPPFPRTVTFGLGGAGDVRAADVELTAGGSRFQLVSGEKRVPVALPLPGRFNVENALAAAAAALVADVPLDAVAERLGDVPPVPGRLEVVLAEPFTVLIDFAHTPGALRGVLGALKPLVRGRLIVVFGAGGDRDRGKRRPMAEAVAALADRVLLTSDNPRTEDPERILDDLEPGLEGVEYQRVPDRREAIRKALEMAGPADVVLLAGKGHERYQVVGTEKRPFDERLVVRECLERGAA